MQEGKNKGTVWITHTALEFPETADRHIQEPLRYLTDISNYSLKNVFQFSR